MAHRPNALAVSRHFQLEQMTEGVYAAISIEGTGSMSNAGIVDLGETTLIFDTFATPQAAQDLRKAAEELIGHPVAYVVNSHRDGDHWWGNQVFLPDADIIATGKTRAALLNQESMNKEKMQLAIEGEIRDLEAKLAQEQDAHKRRSQANEIATRREVLKAIPTFEWTIPTLTFEQQLTLHGSKRTVEVHTYGGGHTASDAFLYLPDDKVLFMGDLLFVRTHPWIGGGDPEEWDRILQRIEHINFSVAVPGHGPLGEKSELALNQRYIASVVALAEECMSKDLPLEEARRMKLPAPFDSWEGAEVFDWNMEFLYNRKK
ncbi:MAG TPA: MBL fold metallo-hydrolase [Ktedonosporobacter sp.]|nr:MBL fold metallo-hydrolase [Ktedonosporobacter sp.]